MEGTTQEPYLKAEALVEPWEDEAWEEYSELDPLIFAALLRLAP